MPRTINIEKAKELTKERLRRERKPLLEAQDVEFLRAQETSLGSTKDIVAEKQRLRDITKQVDSMKSIEKLKTASIDKGKK